MSAQINTIDQLLAATRAAKAEAARAEAERAQAAEAAGRKVLVTHVNQTLSDVLRILGLTQDQFAYTRAVSGGWEASVSWLQDIDGESYPLELVVTAGQAIISCDTGIRQVAHGWLKPGLQDPVESLGDFLTRLPSIMRAYRKDADNAAKKRLRDRVRRSDDISQLLAVAAAVDAEDALSDESRRDLRADIAKEIRNIRNEERTARNARNARLIYAVEIIELAQAYVYEHAWYELACYDWATEWTRELWAPGELYKVRYVPVTADGNTEHCIQELVVVDHPSTLDMGDWNSVVTEVTSHGHVCKRWIGAFLDAKPIRWDKPLITDRFMYHTHIRAGDFYVNIPPADLVPVDTDAVEAARPEPPARWVDWLRERYSSPWQIDVPATRYPSYPAPMDAFDVARMTPAEFVDSPKINI